jgi:hypothetical protein
MNTRTKILMVSSVLVALYLAALATGLTGYRVRSRVIPAPRDHAPATTSSTDPQSSAADPLPASIAPPDRKAELARRSLDDLEAFAELNTKVLLSASERRQIELLLSDSNLIRRCFLLLSQVVPPDELATNQELRILTTNYLVRGLKWAENPAREQIIESLKSLIVLDNLGDSDDLGVRKSFAGDKVEAYITLRKLSPETARELQKTDPKSRLFKLIQFAENMYKFSTRNPKPL